MQPSSSMMSLQDSRSRNSSIAGGLAPDQQQQQQASTLNPSASVADFTLMPSPGGDPAQIPIARPLHHTPSLLLINRTTDFSTTSYELNTFNPPPTPSQQAAGEAPAKAPAAHLAAQSNFMMKLSILLSRSSGRDKLAAFMQYGAMFVADQRLVPVQDKTACQNLEESMSTGRKTLRLFKWLKEFERMERAFYFVDPGPHESKLRRTIASLIGLFMHTCSFMYYVVDNILYCSQTGLIRPPQILSLEQMREVLQLQTNATNKVLDDSFVLLQQKFHLAKRAEFENQLKDWKNLSSLFRLLSALVYCSIQIDSANHALGKEREQKKRRDLEDLKHDSWTEIFASLCNLGILLNRLRFLRFDRIPLWGVGLMGIGSAVLGLQNNWPVEKREE